ncbi:endopeptidase [Mycobacteroides abscessus subsp. abscessus]|uniref:S1 family peptidase n=1 Tax=Mycobacteroides abscessus TaxID=36809 RepID=UPI000926FE44|nr:S1 family peptidase [Mycobacteroides abscessus]SIH35394.1 endopeptidase [Mycobacteroides abscessus subsp. abscessus]
MSVTTPRTLTAIAILTALIAAAPLAHSSPALPPEQDLHPGAALIIAGTENSLCTAGFVARNSKGAPVMFTAGHCDTGGEVSLNSLKAGGTVPVAEFVATEYGGSRGEQPDVAVMKLSGSVALNPAIADQIPVTGYLSDVYNGMMLCKVGISTGRSCGRVTSSTASKVKFDAEVAPGDSGGPVYAMKDDGTAAAVGITIRTAGDDGKPVAELIGPWLDRWGLSIA